MAEKPTAKEILKDIMPFISCKKISEHFFKRSSSWLYQKINETNNKSMSIDEIINLSSVLMELSDKLSECSNNLKSKLLIYPETIKLDNRYNHDLFLRKINDKNDYILDGDEWSFNYVRYGYKDDIENIEYIDPDGGPFIRIYSNLNDYLYVEKIINDKENKKFILRLTNCLPKHDEK